MSYKVLAPLVLAVDQDGHTHHVYKGGLIEWLAEEQEAHFISEGFVELVADEDEPELDPVVETPDDGPGEGGDADGDPESGEGDEPPALEKPPRIALKGVLVDWLVENTEGYTQDDLEKLTKEDLWDLIDAVEAPESTGSED